MDQHSGIPRQRIAGLPPLLELHLPLRVTARAAPTVHADLVAAFNFYVVAGLGKHEAIPLGSSCPPGSPLKQGAFRAFSPFSKLIPLRTIVHPMYVDLDGACQLLLTNPLPDAGSGEPISRIIPFPVAIGEADILGLVSREVRLDPPHFC